MGIQEELSSLCHLSPCSTWVSQVVMVVKNLPANARDLTDAGQIPGIDSKNLMDRGVWWPTVRRVSKSRTQLERLSTHACTQIVLISATPSGMQYYCKIFPEMVSFNGFHLDYLTMTPLNSQFMEPMWGCCQLLRISILIIHSGTWKITME